MTRYNWLRARQALLTDPSAFTNLRFGMLLHQQIAESLVQGGEAPGAPSPDISALSMAIMHVLDRKRGPPAALVTPSRIAFTATPMPQLPREPRRCRLTIPAQLALASLL